MPPRHLILSPPYRVIIAIIINIGTYFRATFALGRQRVALIDQDFLALGLFALGPSYLAQVLIAPFGEGLLLDAIALI